MRNKSKKLIESLKSHKRLSENITADEQRAFDSLLQDISTESSIVERLRGDYESGSVSRDVVLSEISKIHSNLEVATDKFLSSFDPVSSENISSDDETSEEQDFD